MDPLRPVRDYRPCVRCFTSSNKGLYSIDRRGRSTRYGKLALTNGDGFTSAQAVLNLAENALNIIYLGLWAKGSPVAVLIGLIATTCTAWKTILYWLMDQQCGWCQTGRKSSPSRTPRHSRLTSDMPPSQTTPGGMQVESSRSLSGYPSADFPIDLQWWLLFALPNSLWIIVPSLIVFLFSYEIAWKLQRVQKIKTD